MPDSLRSIHVVAGVIADARGRVLLTRRTETRDMPGLWEFPGGKREPGESSEQALARELNEELGIEAEIGEWLIEVPQLYPDKRLRLEVRRIARWKGNPRGREGQALTWVAPERLTRYSMPPADLPVVALLRQPEHYLQAALADADEEGWLRRIDALLRDGARRIHLCMPRLEAQRCSSLLERVMALCGRRPVQWLLEGDAELARRFGIGLHLPATQLDGLQQRPLPADLPLAASCASLPQLQQAQRIGCDFAVVAPASGAANEPDWSAFERLREQVSLPIYVAGGLVAGDIAEARRHGAQGVALLVV